MSKKIHYTINPPCKVGNRWGSSVITSTRDPKAVTCENCLESIRKQRPKNKKQYIKTFLAAIADLADTWNEPADEEQGCENNPVVIVVYEDGGGFIGNGNGVHKLKHINIAEIDDLTIQGEFDNLDQAFRYLDEWMPDETQVEIEP